jgi:hypothetical protein
VQIGGEEERPELQLVAAEVLFKWAGGFHTSGSSSSDKRGTEGNKLQLILFFIYYFVTFCR